MLQSRSQIEKERPVDMNTGLTEQEKESLLKLILTSSQITMEITPGSTDKCYLEFGDKICLTRFLPPDENYFAKLVIKAMNNLSGRY